MPQAAAAVRISGLEDPTREPAVYRLVLGPRGLGPRLVSSGVDWLVLEQSPAVELWQIGEDSVWVEVAEWLAALHDVLARADFTGVPLVEYGRSMFEMELDRAVGVSSKVRAAHEIACRIRDAEPPGIVHGDLYPSNLLVEIGPPLRVTPVDWELVGRGAAVLDLAALVAGGWSKRIQEEMAAAYFRRVGVIRREDWQMRLDAARLQVCLRWLGVPGGWEPPPDHRQDWAAAADWLAEGLLECRNG